MNNIETTIIFRHRRENLKKCSLRGLEKRSDFLFFSYPTVTLFNKENYILLTPDASSVLSLQDRGYGLLLLDATWRLAAKMEKNIVMGPSIIKRALPSEFITAYPRRQDDCIDRKRGLASIEALYIAYYLLGYSCEGLLDNYLWADLFLEKNQQNF